jgi:hypothetical protein
MIILARVKNVLQNHPSRLSNNRNNQYIEPNPNNANEAAKALRPLAAAEVFVEEDEINPGDYSSSFFLKPHYQLEGLTVSLRPVSKLPSGRTFASYSEPLTGVRRQLHISSPTTGRYHDFGPHRRY